jgi:hypothetical protein
MGLLAARGCWMETFPIDEWRMAGYELVWDGVRPMHAVGQSQMSTWWLSAPRYAQWLVQ